MLNQSALFAFKHFILIVPVYFIVDQIVVTLDAVNFFGSPYTLNLGLMPLNLFVEEVILEMAVFAETAAVHDEGQPHLCSKVWPHLIFPEGIIMK